MPGKKNKNIPAIPLPEQAVANIAGKDASSIPKWVLPAVLVFTAIIYCRALQNGLTNFDDDFYISHNPFLRDFSWDGIKAIFTSFYGGNYHPLTTLTYLFEYTLFGLNPLTYHLLGVLLHIFNTWLVFRLAEQLSGKKITALVVCILFALHPMHVESVAWASETKDVLYAAFYLSSLLIYLRYISSGFKTKFYITAILFFLLSLFSKSAAVTLPVLLIAIDLYKGRKLNLGLFIEKIPFLALSVLFGVVNLFAQKGAMTDLNSTYTVLNRIFLFTSSLSFYLVKLVAPFGLSALHFFPGVNHGLLPLAFYLSLPFLMAVAWLITWRNAYRKEIIFGTSFFLITISVMLQIIAVGSALASERYTYIPYIGLFYIAGQWIAGTGINKYQNIVFGVFSAVVIVFSIQTFNRIGVWKNDGTLFGDIIKKDTPHSTGISQGFFRRGMSRSSNGDSKGAMEDFTQSVLFCPKFENGWFQRGALYYSLGDLKSAIADYSKVIQLDPKLVAIYSYRGWAYFQSGNIDSAILDYNKIIALDAANAEAYSNRGWALYGLGRKQAAMLDYNKALSINSKFSGAYNNRGWAWYEAGDTAAAINDYNNAIRYDPKNNVAYSNLAAIRANTGNLEGSLADYDSLIKLTPKDNAAINTRAIVRFNLKDTAGACEDWEKAAELGNANAAQMMQQYCH